MSTSPDTAPQLAPGAGAGYNRSMEDNGPLAPHVQRLKIGQAAAELGIKPFVLRFWETEFPQLEPLRTPKGQRVYGPEQLKLARRIKHLLYEQKLTIDGARKALSDEDRQGIISEIVAELQDIRRLL